MAGGITSIKVVCPATSTAASTLRHDRIKDFPLPSRPIEDQSPRGGHQHGLGNRGTPSKYLVQEEVKPDLTCS